MLICGCAGQVTDVLEKLRWFLAAGYMLVGVGWIVVGTAGTTKWVQVAIGIVWLAGGVVWLLGLLLRHRRRQQSATGQL
jgi:hypothetical protein